MGKVNELFSSSVVARGNEFAGQVSKFEIEEINAAIKAVQGNILDALEQEFDEESIQWETIRRRILRCLGDRGLSRRIQVILGVVSEDGGVQ